MTTEHQGPPPGYVPFVEDLPTRTPCPNGCDALATGIDWRDGQEHEEDSRCTRCGTIWKGVVT